MLKHLEDIKGIHPGIILEQELKRRGLKKKDFAAALNEHPQTIVAITKARRNMNTTLALKAEKALGMEEGTLMVLQVYHEIAMLKSQEHRTKPDISKLRKILFWDTNIESIDWVKHKNAAIKRVFAMGNQTEKDEIMRFYVKSSTESVLNSNA